MFESFEVGDVEVSPGVLIHFRHGGHGEPLLLLHGNTLTQVSWHKGASQLAENFPRGRGRFARVRRQ